MTQNFDRNLPNFLVVDEKCFDLLQDFRVQVFERPCLGVQKRLICHRDQSIIAICVSLFFLFSFEGSNYRAFNQTSWEERIIGEDEHVQRIAVLGLCGRYKTKIVWKHHPFRHHFGQLELSGRRLVLYFVPAAFWGFDDDGDRTADIRGAFS